MKIVYLMSMLMAIAVATSCGNNKEDEPVMKDPSTVHPPSEAIPDSTKLVNDSTIMPDTIPGNGSQVGNSDSIQRNKQ